jgi:hypothetical protein
MLNCRQFAERATDAEEYASASFSSKLNIKFHLFMCRHCRKYNLQFRTTTIVAKKLTTEDASETIIDKAVDNMKNYSDPDNSPLN